MPRPKSTAAQVDLRTLAAGVARIVGLPPAERISALTRLAKDIERAAGAAKDEAAYLATRPERGGLTYRQLAAILGGTPSMVNKMVTRHNRRTGAVTPR